MWQVAPTPVDALPSVRLRFCIEWDGASQNSSTSRRGFGVTMQNLRRVLLGLLFCPSALLLEHSVHLQPSQLNLTEGETATFACSVSSPDFGRHLNWYKWGHDHQPAKLDAGSGKYHFSKRDRCKYEMEIRNVAKNDSGTYYCWMSAFDLTQTILDSNQGNLTVAERATAAPPQDEVTSLEEKEDCDRRAARSPLADLRGSGLFALLVASYFLAWWMIRRRRQKQEKMKDGNSPLVEDPPAVNVFTVNYEMLEFPGGKKPKPDPSPKSVSREQTEYATIVFLPKTLDAAETTDSKQASCPVSAQQF